MRVMALVKHVPAVVVVHLSPGSPIVIRCAPVCHGRSLFSRMISSCMPYSTGLVAYGCLGYVVACLWVEGFIPENAGLVVERLAR